MIYRGDDLSQILFKFNDSDFAISHFEDLRDDMADDACHDTPNSVLEDPICGYGGSDYRTKNSGSKKKGGFLMLSFSSRRKGAPQRSPLS